MKYNIGDIADLNFLKSVDRCSNFFNFNKQKPTHSLVERGKYVYVLEKIGSCDFKKCKNACCKFVSIGVHKKHPAYSYYQGFGQESKSKLTRIIKQNCYALCKNGTCSKWGKKFPKACLQFPHITDHVYHEVIDVCTIKYRIIDIYLLIRNKKNIPVEK